MTLLGTVTPTLEWLRLPTSTFADSFLITFQGNPRQINSYGMIRQVFPGTGATSAVSVYPKNEPLILDLPAPSAGVLLGERFLEVKKWPRRYFRYELPDIAWSLRIEELL